MKVSNYWKTQFLLHTTSPLYIKKTRVHFSPVQEPPRSSHWEGTPVLRPSLCDQIILFQNYVYIHRWTCIVYSRNYHEVHTGKEQSTSSISWDCKVKPAKNMITSGRKFKFVQTSEANIYKYLK